MHFPVLYADLAVKVVKYACAKMRVRVCKYEYACTSTLVRVRRYEYALKLVFKCKLSRHTKTVEWNCHKRNHNTHSDNRLAVHSRFYPLDSVSWRWRHDFLCTSTHCCDQCSSRADTCRQSPCRKCCQNQCVSSCQPVVATDTQRLKLCHMTFNIYTVRKFIKTNSIMVI